VVHWGRGNVGGDGVMIGMGREQVGHSVGCGWGRMARGDISFISVGGHWHGV
jgi:hypothetical protein